MIPQVQHIYLIEAQNHLVKIGCGLWPKARLQACATHSPILVRLIAQWPGVLADERSLHDRFEEYRSHREWFRVDGWLQGFVDEVRGRGLDRIDEWAEIQAPPLGGGISAYTRQKRSEAMKRAWADPAHRQSLVDGASARRRRSEAA